MTRSMTGFGQAAFSIAEDTFRVEVKSLNHRFLDVNLRTPEGFSSLEHRIRDEVKKRFARGAFSIFVVIQSGASAGPKLNLEAAKAYIEAARTLKKELNVGGEIDAEAILRLKDIFLSEKKFPDADACWAPLKEALYIAFEQANKWREA